MTAIVLVAASLLILQTTWGAPSRSLVVVLGFSLVVPYWIGLEFLGIQVPLIVVVCIAMTAVLLAHTRTPLQRIDAVVLLIAGVLGLSVLLGRGETYDASVAVGLWLLPFAFGRLIGASVSEDRLAVAFASFAVVLSIFSVLEFALEWHPFVNWGQGTNSHATWSAIQQRAGFSRSEWTFGHAIALGNVIAAGIPFVMTLRASWLTRVALLGVLVAGIGATLSRNAIVAGVLTLCVVAVLLGASAGRGARVFLLWSLPFLAGIGWFSLSSLGASSGAETAMSTQARILQWGLFQETKGLGISDAATVLSDGSHGFWTADYSRGFTSTVDNALLLIALRSGLVVAGLVACVLLWVTISQTRRTYRNAAGVAVVSQLFTIATTAMITYYAVIVWMLIGIAVTIVGRRRITDAGTPDPIPPAPARSSASVERS